MDYLEFILYGLIQGLTEFIPVSSTAHLKIVSLLFGFDDPGSSLSAIIQIGSILAIIYYFKKDIFYLLNKNSNKKYKLLFSSKLLKSIFIGTIPIICIGAIIKFFLPQFSNSFLRSSLSIGVISIVMSFIMFIADRVHNQSIKLSNHKYIDSLYIGFAQALAIIPGVSRSGSTISMALLSGWERKDATKFSFLLGIPSISLAAFVEFLSSLNELSIIPILPLLLGLVTAFLSSLMSLNFLINYISSKGLKIFIYYRFIFGFLIILNLNF